MSGNTKLETTLLHLIAKLLLDIGTLLNIRLRTLDIKTLTGCTNTELLNYA